MKYNRVLLKLSGEALMGSKQYGIDNDLLTQYAAEIKTIVDAGAQVAIVIGVPTRLQSAIEMRQISEPFIRRRAVRHLEKNRVVIFGAGTGNPYFTTDTAATLRAVEIEANVVLKGTRVDGIYTADPEKDKTATKYERITFDEAYEKNLNVMDLTAFTLCKENNLPIIVFDMNTKGNLLRVINGESVGTIVELK